VGNSVLALAGHDGELIAGGNFGSAGGYENCYWARWACYDPGDLNCDGLVNTFDIDPFVIAITDPDVYYFILPDCDPMLADINGDGVVNTFDIDPFVGLLTGGGKK
jgi:hypothetical protein